MPSFTWTPEFAAGSVESYRGRTAYEQAQAFLRNRTKRKLGNNTWLEVNHRDPGRIDVIHHQTPIVRYYEDGRIIVNTEGYRSVSTKARINEFQPASFHQKDWEWYWSFDGETGVYEGELELRPEQMRVRKPRSLLEAARLKK